MQIDADTNVTLDPAPMRRLVVAHQNVAQAAGRLTEGAARFVDEVRAIAADEAFVLPADAELEIAEPSEVA